MYWRCQHGVAHWNLVVPGQLDHDRGERFVSRCDSLVAIDMVKPDATAQQ